MILVLTYYFFKIIFYFFQDALNRAILQDLRSNRENIQVAVLMVETVYRQNLFGYHAEQLLFLKITVALPRLIAAAKRLLERDNIFGAFPNHNYQAFESNIDFDIRLVFKNCFHFYSNFSYKNIIK